MNVVVNEQVAMIVMTMIMNVQRDDEHVQEVKK